MPTKILVHAAKEDGTAHCAGVGKVATAGEEVTCGHCKCWEDAYHVIVQRMEDWWGNDEGPQQLTYDEVFAQVQVLVASAIADERG